MMETRVVEEERVRAVVKSVHIRKLKRRLSVKKDCGGKGEGLLVRGFGGGGRNRGKEGGRTARIRNSMNALWGERERKEDIAAAQEDVSSVVVLDILILAFPSYCMLSYP